MNFNELSTKAGFLISPHIVGKIFKFKIHTKTLIGIIAAMNDANDDGWLSLEVSSKRFRGDLILSIDFDGKDWLLITQDPRGKTEVMKGSEFRIG